MYYRTSCRSTCVLMCFDVAELFVAVFVFLPVSIVGDVASSPYLLENKRAMLLGGHSVAASRAANFADDGSRPMGNWRFGTGAVR